MTTPALDLASFARTGVVTLAGLVSDDDIDELFRTLALIAARALPAGEAPPTDRRELERRMIRLRETDPKAFSRIYEAMNHTMIVTNFFARPALCNVAEKMLGDPAATLTVRHPILRMDVPNDQRTVYDWHQDSAYTDMNLDGASSVVCWIPLQDVNEGNGSIHVLPGSHVEGRIAVESTRRGPMSAEQRRVPDDIVARYPDEVVIAKGGSAVFLHGNMVHRSGHNSSERIRFTLLARYHRVLSDDFSVWRPRP